MKKLIVFDLDGTLAPSKSSLAPQTAELLRDLLGIIKVAVISGGAWEQFEKQLLTDLPQGSLLANLSLLPTCGTKFFQYNGKWEELYSEDLTAEQKKKIIDSLDKAAGEAGYRAKKVWGKVIEDRSALPNNLTCFERHEESIGSDRGRCARCSRSRGALRRPELNRCMSLAHRAGSGWVHDFETSGLPLSRICV
jgi:hydroxymethylpyrimidine pyrophosphatase-like HAD family hydrolase